MKNSISYNEYHLFSDCKLLILPDIFYKYLFGNLIDYKDNLYQTFKKFKEEWHNIGQVPITERNNIWETYPFVKFFKGDVLIEIGYKSSHWDVHYMMRF